MIARPPVAESAKAKAEFPERPATDFPTLEKKAGLALLTTRNVILVCITPLPLLRLAYPQDSNHAAGRTGGIQYRRQAKKFSVESKATLQ